MKHLVSLVQYIEKIVSAGIVITQLLAHSWKLTEQEALHGFDPQQLAAPHIVEFTAENT